MKLATNIRKTRDLGFQLILDDSNKVIGVNLLCNKKILLKKRFDKAVTVKNFEEENELVNRVFSESIMKV